MQGRFANRPCRHAACGTGDFALKVAVGHHRDELVDGVLAGRERSAAVATRGDAPLDGLAGVPVLAVGDVPEVAGVGGVEAFLLDGLAGEEPLALHGALVASVFETARAADADPAPIEEVLLLPPEHGTGGVRLGGESTAAAESV